MAIDIPPALKSLDIGRFAVRAAQLEKAKPIIAYWCNFWIVNQIIEKGLHTADDEIKLYTTNLMEKLEQFKVENPDNDAILDSMAASAYVEQFGLEVFSRAEATMRADKVTKQTADTFQAAATFLELCQIWNPLEPEVAAKVKFAKYHAVRIVKAIKAGEDPNVSNPKVEEEKEQADILQEQPADVDSAAASSSQAGLQPTVEDVPDDSQYALPSRSPPSLPQPPSASSELPSVPQGPASTLSRGVDANHDQGSPLDLPSAPNTFASSEAPPSLPDTPTNIGAHHHNAPSNEFQSFPPPAVIPPTSPPTTSHDVHSFYKAPGAADSPRSAAPTGPGRAPSYLSHQPAPIATPPVTAPAASAQVNTQDVDDQAIALAQKHARWAVSALAFDDVNTAIKELRTSLRHLGAE
ncbi:Vta1 like-domain-containing protein [Aspergillus egyptiacus]|nr:Vta1 like-domain-containing protein [Aspergillus egyptiacus]